MFDGNHHTCRDGSLHTSSEKNKTGLHPEKNASLFAYRALKIAHVKL